MSAVDQANSAAAVAHKAMQNMQNKQEFISHITSQLKQERAPILRPGSALYAAMSSSYSDSVGCNLESINQANFAMRLLNF